MQRAEDGKMALGGSRNAQEGKRRMRRMRRKGERRWGKGKGKGRRRMSRGKRQEACGAPARAPCGDIIHGIKFGSGQLMAARRRGTGGRGGCGVDGDG